MIIAAAGSAKTYWYLTRGTGVVALLILTASMVLGVLTALRWRGERWPRFVTAGLHRNLTLLAIAFVTLHVVTTVLDGYAPIGLKDAVIPFVSRYRPVWLGLGAVAFDLLLALVVTSLLRARLGHRMWRGLHWLAYAAWPVALIHALGTGSDTRLGWMRAVGIASLALVAAAVLARVALRREGSPALRLAGGCAAVLTPLAILVWYHAGPAQPGWATRAGTPTSLLAAHRTPRVARRGTLPGVRLPLGPFSASLRGGTIKESNDMGGLVTLVIAGRLHGGPGGAIRIDLRGQATESGVSMAASGVSFVPAGARSVYTGSVTALAGQQVDAVVVNGTGQRIHLNFALNIDAAAGTVSGAVAGSSA